MSDHWQIDRPTILAVSGGRTSMHMLWRYLDRHDGRLPGHAVPVFCNTGKEHPLTLDFVHRCSIEWGVRIVWLEYAEAEKPADRWREVSHNSASREGEPFAALIRNKRALPHGGMRFCTEELKVFLVHRWAVSAWPHGRERYVKAVGYRADEGHRVAAARARCGKKPEPWNTVWPLFAEGMMTRVAIREWWSRQPFDLETPGEAGNCDLCWLKGVEKRAAHIQAEPSSADWWIEQEQLTGRLFRSPKRRLASYRHLKTWALSDAPKSWKQGELDLADLDCTCTD